ncbi:MAG: cobalamin biosynthesis protein [Candidatus Tectomicrobia bacterium]
MFPLIAAPLSLVVALVLDQLLGDPPNRLHPVAWMGTAIGVARRWAPRQGRWLPLLYGAGVVGAGVVVVACVGFLVQQLFLVLPWPLPWLLEAWMVKMTFSLQGLARAASQVRQALEAQDLAQARHLLSWHLVSRDTSQLNESQVAAAAVESVAENASDGIVAPLLYYALGGLPAALVYRFVNTADSMLGYRDPDYLWLGKVPARLDDLVNLVPARLTAALVVLASLFLGGNARSAWTTWRRDAHRTASPNAGHPMSSMAGALGLELVKIGHYQLGAGQALPAVSDIARAVHLLYGTAALAVVLCVILMTTLSQ